MHTHNNNGMVVVTNSVPLYSEVQEQPGESQNTTRWVIDQAVKILQTMAVHRVAEHKSGHTVSEYYQPGSCLNQYARHAKTF